MNSGRVEGVWRGIKASEFLGIQGGSTQRIIQRDGLFFINGGAGVEVASKNLQ